jgi:hypothetical protein
MSNNNTKSKTVNQSIVRKLKEQNLINDETLVVINSLTIENLIAVKLELSANNLNNRLYGFDIWKKSDHIIKDGILKFAVSVTKSKKDAARFLSLSYSDFNRLYKKYKIGESFENMK